MLPLPTLAREAPATVTSFFALSAGVGSAGGLGSGYQSARAGSVSVPTVISMVPSVPIMHSPNWLRMPPNMLRCWLVVMEL